ncbi:redoxin domain-containing protein [Halieaceae bacterium IMCC14734]|uniref:Redoxin domain-containing protein n=1 Tax=Candidatus Litorirhabdus singularis TaxID=2518993 RepID=A0ABT3TI90_9GAMM|nr:redoxin domain-containing protein [Candidatus Litorirhabdus singularis]MCX2982047.1 redoxin domain-containing protein [Candidatus Litorirhabdus singularis]
MTQLVELRDAYKKFQAAGVKLYAISYDRPDELAEFAAHHDINFPLLSDKGSRLIRQLGILNTHVTRDQVPFYGIPYPGTYVLNEQGVITGKLFGRNHHARFTGESMLDSALGEILIGEDEPMASTDDEQVNITAVWHGGGGTVKASVVREIVVRFELAEGLHIYDEPVPQGMVATRVEVTGPEGFHTGDMRKPATHTLELPELDTALQVWSNQVDLAIPVWVDDSVVSLLGEQAEVDLEIALKIHYQACDDQVCHIPQSRDLTLRVPFASYTAPNLFKRVAGLDISAMDSQQLMKRKIRRGLLRSPIGGLRFLRKMASDMKKGPMGKRRGSS